jgi:hypothetical protein
MISQLEQDIINSNIKNYVYEIEWLTHDENVIDNVAIDVISGNVNFDDENNNKRSANFTLTNLNKQYLPFESTKMQINNKVRLKCGYKYGNNNQKFMYNQGVYILGNPNVLSNTAQKEVSLQLLDKWTLLDGTIAGKLKNKYIIPVNTRIDIAIKALVVDIIGETKYIIDECSEQLPYTITKDMGNTVADLIVEICDIVSYDAFYNDEGVFVFRKKLDIDNLQTLPVSWYYTTSGIYLGSNREINWNDIRNSIKVIGMTKSNGVVCQGVAQDTNINSRFSIPNIGERFELIDDENIYTSDLAILRANYELQKRIIVNEKVTANIVPNFSHKVGNIINIIDENNGCNSNYYLQSIDFNFGYDSVMNLGLWSIRDWR